MASCTTLMPFVCRVALSTVTENSMLGSIAFFPVETDTPCSIPLGGVRLGILICWDNNLIENARATALLGAEILLAPHQAGGGQSVSPHALKRIPVEKWENRLENPEAIEAEFKGPNGRAWFMRWLPSRAHDNGMFVIFSNGVGRDVDEVRTGNAMILDPYGRIVAETWEAADAIVSAEIDLGLLEKCTGQRWLRGRRPELYGVLTDPRPDNLSPMDARFSQTPTRKPTGK